MQTKSPTNNVYNVDEDTKDMTFLDALKLVMMGKKVHSLSWEDRAFYLHIDGGFLRLHKPDGKNHDFITSEVDLNAEDYIQIF